MWYMLFFVPISSDTINTQVHETMKTTPYELVFGQPPRSVIVPDSTVGGIMDETAIQLDDGYSDDTHSGDGNGSQEDTPSRADDVDNVLKSQVSVYIFAVYIRTCYLTLYLYCN